ncbi:MAG TPA: hypothetical protein VHC86_08840 [Opitutaceae bacterium]|nr:hypothetical protein [Opitutaceae bacterium]
MPLPLRRKLVIDYYLGSLLHALLKPPTIAAGKLLRRDHDLQHCSSVTVLKMLGGGSLVIAYPALLALKRSTKIRRLCLVTTPAVEPFARVLGLFDEIITIRDRSLTSLAADSARAAIRLRRCDALVDLEVHSRLTTVFSLLTCARNRLGFYTGESFWRRRLSTHLLFANVANGIHQSYDQIAGLFGAPIPPAAECQAQFRLGLGLTAPGAPEKPRRIALAPCCSDLSRERMLRPTEWGAILRARLGASPPEEFHLLAGPGDGAVLEEIRRILAADFPGIPALNHAGLPLEESVRQLARCQRLFSIDSALLHFGRLLGVPTVSFWGPTDPASLLRAGPAGRDEIHYRKISCSPCVHLAQQPPCGGDNLCMRLAADPSLMLDLNPAWIVADRDVRRFFRKSAP